MEVWSIRQQMGNFVGVTRRRGDDFWRQGATASLKCPKCTCWRTKYGGRKCPLSTSAVWLNAGIDLLNTLICLFVHQHSFALLTTTFHFYLRSFRGKLFWVFCSFFLPIYNTFVWPTFFFLCGLFSAAKPVSGKRDYPQTIHTLAFIQDMHEKGFAAQ